VTQLAGLIELINGELTKLDRKKLITLCTIDVHARDVVQRLIDERVESATAFQWQSQLRYIVSEKTKATQVGWGAAVGDALGQQLGIVRLPGHSSTAQRTPNRLTEDAPFPLAVPSPPLQVNICDAEIAYNHEYIGNCGALCITPLTDRSGRPPPVSEPGGLGPACGASSCVGSG
jgi:dynein heavy chain, axonemal